MAPMPAPRLPSAQLGIGAIRAAARHGRLDELTACIARGLPANEADEDGATPLLMACCYGHTSCVDALVRYKADINVQGKHGITPTFYTCQENKPDCLKLLIAAGADLNKANTQDGGTPLYIACSKNNAECVRLLLENGADVNKPRIDGSTALQAAIRKKHTLCAKLCIQYGADIDMKLPPANKTPFQMAMDMVFGNEVSMRKEYLVGMFEPPERVTSVIEELRKENKALNERARELETGSLMSSRVGYMGSASQLANMRLEHAKKRAQIRAQKMEGESPGAVTESERSEEGADEDPASPGGGDRTDRTIDMSEMVVKKQKSKKGGAKKGKSPKSPKS